MTIKGKDDKEYDVASSGVGGAGLGLGIAGTALGLLNGGLGILGTNRGYGYNNGCSCTDGNIVSKYELQQEQTIAALNSQIALLNADKYTDQKLVDVYNNLYNKIETLESVVRQNKEEQAQINSQQAVYNGTNNAVIATLRAQVAQLLGITKTVIPNSVICPGWGDVTVTTSTTTTESTTE